MSKELHEAGVREGERRKQAALGLLAERRAVLVRRGRRALLTVLLCQDTATADDVAEAVTVPDDLDPRWLGAVPGGLAKAGLIYGDGYVKSRRPQRHASILQVWKLADRSAALDWLARNPDLPDPTEDAEVAAGSRELPFRS